MGAATPERSQLLHGLAPQLAGALARPGIADDIDTQRPGAVGRLVLAAVATDAADGRPVCALLAPHAERTFRRV